MVARLEAPRIQQDNLTISDLTPRGEGGRETSDLESRLGLLLIASQVAIKEALQKPSQKPAFNFDRVTDWQLRPGSPDLYLLPLSRFFTEPEIQETLGTAILLMSERWEDKEASLPGFGEDPKRKATRFDLKRFNKVVAHVDTYNSSVAIRLDRNNPPHVTTENLKSVIDALAFAAASFEDDLQEGQDSLKQLWESHKKIRAGRHSNPRP